MQVFHRLQPHQGCIEADEFYVKNSQVEDPETDRLLDFRIPDAKETSFGMRMKAQQEADLVP